MDPEGFWVREGRRQQRILWDELADVQLRPAGKAMHLQIDWQQAGREKPRSMTVWVGMFQGSHVAGTLQWYRNHPERRFKLKRA